MLFNLKTMHMLLKKKRINIFCFHVPGAGMHLYKYNFLVLSVSVNHEFLFSDAGEKSILI